MSESAEQKRHPVWVIGVTLTVIGGAVVAANFVASQAGMPAYGWVVGVLMTLTGLIIIGFGSIMAWPKSSPVAPVQVAGASELERLAKLYNEGVLTETEYSAAKARALGR